MTTGPRLAIALMMIVSLGTLPPLLRAQAVEKGQTRKASPWPPQIGAQVPCQPAAFPSEGSQHLFYELYLTNFSPDAMPLDSVEVIDPAAPSSPPLAHFTGQTLAAIARLAGKENDASLPTKLPAGGTLVLFLEVKVPAGRPVPRQMAHRLVLGDAVTTTGLVHPDRRGMKVLGRPVTGAGWLAADGPGSDPDNHHRRGIFIRDGVLTDSRRLAIDWKMVKDGKSWQGDPHLATSYFAYDKPLLAVADAVVVQASDGQPDNPPGHGADFHPAAPIDIDNVGGNHVVLALGDGEYAHYFHMRSGSLRVKTGDHVRRGQIIGAIGSSGDAREPHVHMEITDAIDTLRSEGLPYVIDHYRIMLPPPGDTGQRERQLPLDGMIIDFGS